MLRNNKRAFERLQVINWLFLTASLALCSILMLVNIPGMELLETNPNWLLIWVVAWSISRTVWQGAIAGLLTGLIYDGIVITPPSHVFSLVCVGMLTAGLQKQKYIGEDFITVAFIVFFMTIFAEAIFAWQYSRTHLISVVEVIKKFQQVAIISAIITSLWSPAFYYPFNLWQQKIRLWQKRVL